MNDDQRTLLEDWSAKVSVALQHPELELDIDGILDLAGTAARVVVRPAAPLTTFIAGYAAGYAAATGTAPAQAMREAVAAADRLGTTDSLDATD